MKADTQRVWGILGLIMAIVLVLLNVVVVGIISNALSFATWAQTALFAGLGILSVSQIRTANRRLAAEREQE